MVFIVAVIAYFGVLLLLPRIWRAGRISDRTTALIVLFTLPVTVLAVLVSYGVQVWLTVFVGAVLLASSALYYRFALTMFADARAMAATPDPWWEGLSRPARWTISAVIAAPMVILIVVLAAFVATGRLG